MKFSPLIINKLNASAVITRLKSERRIQMDNTEFTDWNGCFVKGLYSGGLRRIPAGGVAPLVFGACVHTGLKHLMLGTDLAFAIEVAQAEATREGLDLLCDGRRNSQTLTDCLTGYFHHIKIMPAQRLVPVELDGQKVVEKTFSFPLGKLHFKRGELLPDEDCDIEVWWSGIIDLFAYYQNEIWVVDHKTTTVMGPKFADDKLRSSQMLGYTHIGRLFGFDKPVRGVLINAIALRSGGFDFSHFPLPMASWKTEEWHAETMRFMYNMIRQLVEFLNSGEAVPIREHCVTKYGKCKFFDLCENVPLVRDRMLFDDNLFKDNNWHPVE